MERVQHHVVEDDRSDKEVPVKEQAPEADEEETVDELEMITQFKVREEQLVVEMQ